MTSIQARLQRYPDADCLSRAAAEAIARIAREAVTRLGKFTIALSGGSTPRRLYELLSEPPLCQEIAWDRVEFFWGDERAVPPHHPDSNFHLADLALLHKLHCPRERIHRMRAEDPDLARAARAYEDEIARVLGAAPKGRPPALDLILLGLGHDGHTASLFPFTEALNENRRWVMCNHIPQLNTNRLTLTAPILNRGKEILILVSGKDKAEALGSVLNGPRDSARFPAQLIRPETGRLIWMVDEAAAACLP
ncbi:MAG TPA: 6-phosphogluconolactonase [Candidatus Binatia bacterium]